MSIKIAVAEEKNYKVPPKLCDDSKNVVLVYKRPSSRQLLNEVSKYQKNGKVTMTETDGVEAMLNLLDDCIIGWKGIQDDKGKNLDFKKEYVEYLPFEVQMDFINNVITPQWMTIAGGSDVKAEAKKEKELGNSVTM